MVEELLELIRGLDVQPQIALIDILLTALLIYGLFSLIRGTRAVRLVVGVTILYAIYVAAQALGLQLLSQIMQAGAVVGLLALVVVFQPELRRALERIGRVGSLGWLLAPAAHRAVEQTAQVVSRTAALLAAEKIGALIVIERETGLQDTAETGVMVEADLSVELLGAIFSPRSPLHDGAVIVRGDRILAAGAVLPLSETAIYRERFGTRHRAAVGITEGTDALAVVVSEETGAISLVVRGRIVRHLDEERLRGALMTQLGAAAGLRLPANTRTLRESLPHQRPRFRRPASGPESPGPAAAAPATVSGAAAASGAAASGSASAGPSRPEASAE
jgi:diadenylate cyclase